MLEKFKLFFNSLGPSDKKEAINYIIQNHDISSLSEGLFTGPSNNLEKGLYTGPSSSSQRCKHCGK